MYKVTDEMLNVALNAYGGPGSYSDAMKAALEAVFAMLEKESVYNLRLEGSEKKVYKLSELWKIWYYYEGVNIILSESNFWKSKEEALDYIKRASFKNKAIAITRADCNEFVEGEGLECT